MSTGCKKDRKPLCPLLFLIAGLFQIAPPLTLPLEMWLHICRYLPHQDLRHLSLVSRLVSSAASDPSLWSNISPEVVRRQVERSGLDRFLLVKRFARIRCLDLGHTRLGSDQYRLLLSHVAGGGLPMLTSLDVSHVDLAGVAAEVVLQALGNLSEVRNFF